MWLDQVLNPYLRLLNQMLYGLRYAAQQQLQVIRTGTSNIEPAQGCCMQLNEQAL